MLGDEDDPVDAAAFLAVSGYNIQESNCVDFCFNSIRNMQEVMLDKHVKLLDSPGIVIGTGSTDTQIILRNCVKVCLSIFYLFHFLAHALNFKKT